MRRIFARAPPLSVWLRFNRRGSALIFFMNWYFAMLRGRRRARVVAELQTKFNVFFFFFFPWVVVWRIAGFGLLIIVWSFWQE